MQWEAVTTGHYLEGLAIADNGDVWFTDVVKGGVHRLSPNGEQQSWLNDRLFLAALAFNHDGRVLFTGAHGIAWLDPATGATGVLLDQLDGGPIPGVSELAPDGEGGVYFGTIDLVSIAKGERSRPSGLYRLHANGKVQQLVGGLKFTNGIGVSSDGARLYHNETFAATYGYNFAADGSLGPPTKLRDALDGDGMAIDTEGGVWISGCRSSALTRLTPNGGQESISHPGEASTNVRFAGNGNTIYVNVVTLDSVNALAKGAMLKNEASKMYRAPAPVRGIPQAHTRFQLS